jgi:hypothetical protein
LKALVREWSGPQCKTLNDILIHHWNRFMKNLFALLSALMLSAALAHGGSIPITTPTVITTSGSYLLANDITSTNGGFAIDIQANDVKLDLGGHTVTATIGSGILLDYLPGTVTGVTNIKVTGGRLTRRTRESKSLAPIAK